MSDQYMDKINEYWDEITGVYVHFEEKKPIIEFEPNTLIISAYSGEDYINGLSPRTLDNTMKQYEEEVVAKGSIMLFVKDSVNEVMRSYIFPKNDEEGQSNV